MTSEERTYVLGIYEKAMPVNLTWREKLEAAKDAGFDTVEISIDETDDKLGRLDMTKEERLDLVSLMVEIGIPIRTMCLSGHRKFPLGSEDPEIRRRSLEIMEKAIDLADDLGIRIIQLAGYDVYYSQGNENTKRLFLDNLKKAVSMAARKGIILAFETMETEFMNTVNKALAYVKEINSPYLQIYPDAGNLTNAAHLYGEDVLEDLEKGRGHISSLHLKETIPGVFREVPYGSGHVDFEKMIEKAWKLGIRFYVAEFWDIGKPNWKDDLYETNHLLTGYLDGEQAGVERGRIC